MPVTFNCLIHCCSQRDRNKSPSQPSHSSEFTVQKGHRKTMKGIINANPTLHLKSGYRQKAMRSQKTELEGQFHTEQCKAIEELKTGLISLSPTEKL